MVEPNHPREAGKQLPWRRRRHPRGRLGQPPALGQIHTNQWPSIRGDSPPPPRKNELGEGRRARRGRGLRSALREMFLLPRGKGCRVSGLGDRGAGGRAGTRCARSGGRGRWSRVARTARGGVTGGRAARRPGREARAPPWEERGAAHQPLGGVPGSRSESPKAASLKPERRRGGSGEGSEAAGANFPEKQLRGPAGGRVTGLPAPRREDPPEATAAGDLSGLERGSESEGRTRASVRESWGRGPSPARARIPASPDAQQSSAPSCLLTRPPAVPQPPPPSGSVAAAQRPAPYAAAARCRRLHLLRLPGSSRGGRVTAPPPRQGGPPADGSRPSRARGAGWAGRGEAARGIV